MIANESIDVDSIIPATSNMSKAPCTLPGIAVDWKIHLQNICNCVINTNTNKLKYTQIDMILSLLV